MVGFQFIHSGNHMMSVYMPWTLYCIRVPLLCGLMLIHKFEISTCMYMYR